LAPHLNVLLVGCRVTSGSGLPIGRRGICLLTGWPWLARERPASGPATIVPLAHLSTSVCTGPNKGAPVLESGMSSQLTETSDMLTRRRELLEASSGMTSSAQSRSSAAAGTILAKGKNRQGPQQQIWLTFGRCCCTASPVHCTALGEALAPQVDAVCGNSAIGAGHVDRPTMVAALGRGPWIISGHLPLSDRERCAEHLLHPQRLLGI